jgi:hypothetical protein
LPNDSLILAHHMPRRWSERRVAQTVRREERPLVLVTASQRVTPVTSTTSGPPGESDTLAGWGNAEER